MEIRIIGAYGCRRNTGARTQPNSANNSASRGAAKKRRQDWVVKITDYRSKRRGVERVAAIDVARLESRLEPARALRRRAVRERIRHCIAARFLLQGVVADLRGGIQRGIDVAGLQPVQLCLRFVAPHACVTVRLQFEAYRRA